MGAQDAAPCIPGQQQAALLHQPVDALGIDGIAAGGSPPALEDRGDPPVSIARQGFHQAPDIGSELRILARVWGPRFGPLPPARSTRLERATPRVSAIRGILRKLRSRQQGRFFPKSLLEDLDLHGLAAEQAFEVSNPFLQPAHFGCGNHILIGSDRFVAPLLISRPPRKTRLGESPWRRAT